VPSFELGAPEAAAGAPNGQRDPTEYGPGLDGATGVEGAGCAPDMEVESFLAGQVSNEKAPRMYEVAGVMRLQSASTKVIVDSEMSKITSRSRMIDAPITVPPSWLSKMAAQ
jgi:hypothetical protein